MNDLKAVILAGVPSSPAVFAAIEAPSTLTIVTSILLPICFFVLSKTVDVCVQLYLKRKK